MAAKLKPCMTENRRHTWEHIGNKTVRRETMQSIEFSRKGVYRCITCGAVKYGEALEPRYGVGQATTTEKEGENDADRKTSAQP